MHPQTLRIYERKGLLDPSRTGGGSRRFSDARHRAAAPHPGADRGRAQPRGRAPGHRARGRGRAARAPSSSGPAPRPREAVEQTHRQYRRDLVPLDQAAGPATWRGPTERATTEETPMALDPNRWTTKTQEAFADAAAARPTAANHAEVTPEHLCWPPARPGRGRRRPAPRPGSASTPRDVAQPARASALAALPQRLRRLASPTLGREPPRRRSSAPTAAQPDMGDEYLSVEHLLLALRRRSSGSPATTCSAALREVRGSHRVTSPEPRGAVPGAREVRPRPHRARPRGQARPGHRPRRGDPPRHPGAVAPHQEQPGAHRRARRRQDRHRRGPGQPHRRRRRARGPEGQAASSRSTSARWSPAPSTAASSRSASRRS